MNLDPLGIAAILAALGALVTSISTAWVLVRKTNEVKIAIADTKTEVKTAIADTTDRVTKAGGAVKELEVQVNSKMAKLLDLVEKAAFARGQKEEGDKRDMIDAAAERGAQTEAGRNARTQPQALTPSSSSSQDEIAVNDKKVESAVRDLGAQQDKTSAAVDSLDKKVTQ